MREETNIGVGRICAPPLILAGLAISLFLIPGAGEALQYEPGRWWGVLTGHFTHWNSSHLLWDVLAFVALGGFCCRFSRHRFWGTLLTSAVAISLAVILWQPELTSYRGLSGIDSALFGLALVEFARFAHREGKRVLSVLAGIAGVGFALKLAYEFGSGGALFVSSADVDFVNVPLAHLVGFGCGLIAALPRGARRARERENVIARVSLIRLVFSKFCDAVSSVESSDLLVGRPVRRAGRVGVWRGVACGSRRAGTDP